MDRAQLDALITWVEAYTKVAGARLSSGSQVRVDRNAEEEARAALLATVESVEDAEVGGHNLQDIKKVEP